MYLTARHRVLAQAQDVNYRTNGIVPPPKNTVVTSTTASVHGARRDADGAFVARQ